MASSMVASSLSRTRSALESLFAPATVAVVGATEREGSVGRTILENLVHSSYRGQVFAVNPKHSELLGVKCYPTVATLPEPVSSTHVQSIAETILRTAQAGETDPVVLQRMALLELQLKRRD